MASKSRVATPLEVGVTRLLHTLVHSSMSYEELAYLPTRTRQASHNSPPGKGIQRHWSPVKDCGVGNDCWFLPKLRQTDKFLVRSNSQRRRPRRQQQAPQQALLHYSNRRFLAHRPRPQPPALPIFATYDGRRKRIQNLVILGVF